MTLRKLLLVLFALLPVLGAQGSTVVDLYARLADPIYLLGDSYFDNVGNGAYLQTSIPTRNTNSDGPTYGMIVSGKAALSQIGRYTPQGTPIAAGFPGGPQPAGRHYAVSTSAIGTDAFGKGGVVGQITLLLADVSNSFPAGSVVIIEIGINDVDAGVSSLGGQYTAVANTAWPLNGTNFTLPSQGTTATVPVTSTTGVTVGQQINFPISGLANNNDVVVTAFVASTSISFVVPAGYGGLIIPTGSNLTTAAQSYINSEVLLLTPKIAALVAAGATVVFIIPSDVSYIPANFGTATLTHNTWLMYLNQIAPLIANSQINVRNLDLQPLYADIIANPTKYGFKDATTIWNQSGSLNPADLLWWDNFHPTAAGHRVIAKYVFDHLCAWGLIKDAIF